MIDLTQFDVVQDASTPSTRFHIPFSGRWPCSIVLYRGSKRKTSEPIPSFRSPRIKRSKITTQLDARGAIFERSVDITFNVYS